MILEYTNDFINRIKLAFSVFFEYKTFDYFIKLDNGTLIDLKNKKIVIPGNFHIHSKGNLSLTSDKHVIIKSGMTEEEREGYLHSIWFNCQEDEFNRPIKNDKEENNDK